MVCVAAVLFLILFFRLIAPGFLSRTAQSFARPLWKMNLYFENAVSNFFSFFYFKSSLLVENKKLRESLGKAESVLLAEKAFEQEFLTYNEFRSQRGKRGEFVVGIILKPPSAPYDVFILDAGSNADIRVGDKVFAYESILLGEIIEVSPKTSKALLYSNAEHLLAVLFAKNGMPAELRGRGGGNFEMILPRDADVSEGDIVVLPSRGNVPVAVAGKIQFLEHDSVKKVLFGLPFNFFSLRFVSVERNGRAGF